jgi:hypothetical protein
MVFTIQVRKFQPVFFMYLCIHLVALFTSNLAHQEQMRSIRQNHILRSHQAACPVLLAS